MTPRIHPLSYEELCERDQDLLLRTVTPTAKVFLTLIRSPDLLRSLLPLGGRMLGGPLNPRWREMVVLRTAYLNRCDYVWGQHVHVARHVGLHEDEIAQLASPPQEGNWTSTEAALLSAATQLHENAAIEESTWNALADELGESELISLPILVGYFRMLALFANALQVDLDPGIAGIPGQHSGMST